MPQVHIKTPLGTGPGDSRFCAKGDNHAVLYAAPEFTTAFIKTIVRDRFTHMSKRKVLYKEIDQASWAQIETTALTTLRLLDLRGDGCVKIGAPTDTTNARSHRAGRSFARAIYTQYKDVDGILFSSRLTGSDAYAVFDRAIAKLSAPDTGDLKHHPDLAGVISTYDIVLITR